MGDHTIGNESAHSEELTMSAWLDLLSADSRDRGRDWLFSSSEWGTAFAAESLLLRLEALRQLLSDLRTLVQDQNRPHLALSPDALRVTVDAGDRPVPRLWTSRLRIVAHPAPPAPSSAAEPVFVPEKNRPKALRPPGCVADSKWIEGVCIPRSGGAAARSHGGIDLNFLPDEPLDTPPSRGTRLALTSETGSASVYAWVMVDVAFSEVCSLSIADPSSVPPSLRPLLENKGAGARVKLGHVQDHGLVDDLFAAGTLWLGWLLADPGDLDTAAAFRDELRSTTVSGTDGAQVSDAKTRARRIVAAAESAKGLSELADRGLLAASLDLGLRMCAAWPDAYPGAGHEPVPRERKVAVYSAFLDDVGVLAERARAILRGVPGADAEVWTALDAYAR